jgi:transposase
LFVGIDAHQETLAIAVFPCEASTPEPVRVIANDPGRVRVLFRQLAQRGPVEAVYEAGCLGFVLYRQLVSLGVDCMVAAPSRIPKLPGDHRKTDRLDATRLAIFLRGSQLTPVSPPTPELEALRTLVRTRQAIQEDVVRARHRLQKFLLTRGRVWRAGCNWSTKHLRWIAEQQMDLADDQESLTFLRTELELRLASLKTLDGRIARRAQEQDVRDKVIALEAFRGVRTLTALSTLAEIGDPLRFGSADQVASYCGLIPSEHSSGERVRRGAITRSGNSRLRRLLVESAQHVGRPIRAGYARETRRARAPAEIAALARRADQRLSLRFHSLHHRKHTNQAKVAVARELVGFLWKALLMSSPS